MATLPSSPRSLPVHQLENDSETEVQKVDGAQTRTNLRDIEIPLHMAKAAIGRALSKVIARTDAVLKDFGDPSHVNRVCAGEVPSVLARAWQTRVRRHQLLRALAEEDGRVTIKTVFEIEESA